MKNWTIHSVWIIGILLALLIGSLSVDWVGIKDLPEIISFAVGLSSLILAVIAIFQTLSSTGSVEASLAAVREATSNASNASQDLASSSAIIHQAAADAQAASSAALNAITDLSASARELLQSNEENRHEIRGIREDIKSKQSSSSNLLGAEQDRLPAKLPPRFSMGGAGLIYALHLAHQVRKKFMLSEIFPEDLSTAFETGYMSSLKDMGLLDYSYDRNRRISVGFIDEGLRDVDRIKGASYNIKETQETHERRVAEIEKFFLGPDADSQDLTDEEA